MHPHGIHAGLVSAAIVVLAAVAGAAQKPVTQGVAVTETFVIEAIDTATRTVTLRDSDGNVESVVCGPEVERFNQLKKGDKVTLRYYESIVYAIKPPGSGPTGASGTAGVVRTPDKPGGTISQQLTAVVTVTALDLKVPSISISTADGRKMSFKLDNPKNAEGVKVGDKVEITYTQALAISVEPPK